MRLLYRGRRWRFYVSFDWRDWYFGVGATFTSWVTAALDLGPFSASLERWPKS
jgi:hypothetical protein